MKIMIMSKDSVTSISHLIQLPIRKKALHKPVWLKNKRQYYEL